VETALPLGANRDDTGFIEGRNVAVDYRWANGQYDRRATLAADLVRHQVADFDGTTQKRLRRSEVMTSSPSPFLIRQEGAQLQQSFSVVQNNQGGHLGFAKLKASR
jgi:hypothetical protein